jgi:esterase
MGAPKIEPVECRTLGKLSDRHRAVAVDVTRKSSERISKMLSYAVHGSGPSRVIALHGLFTDGRGYDLMLAAIDPRRWTIMLPDIRGYGGSAAIGGPFDVATVASDVLGIVDHLGWERFSLIGHSMGGKASLRIAVDAPTRIDRIVGISPIWAGAVPFKAEQLAYFRSSVERIEARATIIAQTTGNRLPAFWCQRAAQASSENSRREAYAGYLESLVFDDFELDAKELDQKILVLVGDQDKANLEMARANWQPKLRHSALTVLKDCGHWSIQEMPLFTAALVTEFLSESGQSSAIQHGGG